MSQLELLKQVATVLGGLGVRYAVTGSHASSIYGEVRTTHDVDVLIDATYGQVHAIVDAFPEPRFYADRRSAIDAARTGTMFNIIDSDSGHKADFWCVNDAPLMDAALARRVTVVHEGVEIAIIAPEDSILSKLQWSRELGGSWKQDADIRGVLRRQAHRLDNAYLDHWAQRLGLADDLARLREQAQRPEP